MAALARGDKVIATSRTRSIRKLDELKSKGAETLELDVTAPLKILHDIAKKAEAIYGHIDVVVNNAGYIAAGTLEETTCVIASPLLCKTDCVMSQVQRKLSPSLSEHYPSTSDRCVIEHGRYRQYERVRCSERRSIVPSLYA